MGFARRGALWCAAFAACAAAYAQDSPLRHEERSDGVTAVQCDPCSSAPAELVVSGGSLYFSADDGIHGRELWRYDADGSVRLAADIGTLYSSSNPTVLRGLGGGVIFQASMRQEGASSANRIMAVPKGSASAYSMLPTTLPQRDTDITVSGGWAYFAADTKEQGRELWVSSGTRESTRITSDSVPGGYDGIGMAGGLPVGDGGMLYYCLAEAVPDLDAGAFWAVYPPDFVPEPVLVQGEVVLDIGTYFRDAAPGIALITARSVDRTRGILQYDGTPEGNCFLYDAGDKNWYCSEVVISGAKRYMVIIEDEYGSELYVSDGKPGDARLVRDIWPGKGGAGPHKLTNVDGRVFFGAQDEAHGMELWTSDGTEAGTHLVKDMIPGPGNGDPYSLYAFQGLCYFSCEHPTLGEELWCTDGTEAGTRLVKDINPGLGDGEPYSLAEFNGRLFFAANDGVHGEELWSTDGTEAGTRLEADIMRPARREPSSHPEQLVAFGGAMYFTAQDAQHGRELWRATPDTAELVADLLEGPASPGIEHLCVLEDRLHFDALGPGGERVHYESDGTAAGMRVAGAALGRRAGPDLESLVPESARAEISVIDAADGLWVRYEDMVVFSGDSAADGWEPRVWRTGMETAALAADHLSGPASSFPSLFTASDEGVYYAAESLAGTRMVFRLDPETLEVKRFSTAVQRLEAPSILAALPGGIVALCATRLPTDFVIAAAGAANVNVYLPEYVYAGAHTAPHVLGCAGNIVYFDFYDPLYGRELWVMVPGEIAPRLVRDIFASDTSSAAEAQGVWRDTPPPPAPVNPAGASPSHTEIVWTWQDVAQDETSYYVYSDPGTAAPQTLAATTPADAESWTAEDRLPNTVYAFSAAAARGGIEGARSPVAVCSTRMQPVAALAFTDLTPFSATVAPAGEFSGLAEGKSGVRVSIVEPGAGSGFMQTIAPFTFDRLTPNTAYTFRGVSRNRDGVESTPFDQTSRTLAATPLAPSLGHATPDSVDIAIAPGDGNPAITQYALQHRNTGQWVQINGSLMSTPVFRQSSAWATTTVLGLAPATEHRFAARARNNVELVETANGPEAALRTLD
ncbi:MAG: hypothetical protein GC168_02575 [Candidatus Hydrogenedens sp.]|nr:hypothetical protein [Candidatus Hydrogenedens sp.]